MKELSPNYSLYPPLITYVVSHSLYRRVDISGSNILMISRFVKSHAEKFDNPLTSFTKTSIKNGKIIGPAGGTKNT